MNIRFFFFLSMTVLSANLYSQNIRDYPYSKPSAYSINDYSMMKRVGFNFKKPSLSQAESLENIEKGIIVSRTIALKFENEACSNFMHYKLLGSQSIHLSFYPDFRSIIKPKTKYSTGTYYEFSDLDKGKTIYIQLIASVYEPLHFILMFNSCEYIEDITLKSFINNGIIVKDTPLAWMTNRNFTYMCPLSSQGYFYTSKFGNANKFNNNGWLNGDDVFIGYVKNDEYYVLKGNMRNSHFIGGVAFAKWIGSTFDDNGAIDKYKVIDYLYFDEQGMPIERMGNKGFLKLMQCGIESGIMELLDNSEIGCIIAEIIGSEIARKDYSKERVDKNKTTQKVVKELKNRGYDKSANFVSILALVECVLGDR